MAAVNQVVAQTLTLDPQQIVGSMMHSPGAQKLTVHSLRDIVAFRCLWAFGEFHQNTVHIQILRWQCSLKVGLPITGGLGTTVSRNLRS